MAELVGAAAEPKNSLFFKKRRRTQDSGKIAIPIFAKKEGTMKIFNMPGDPKASAVFLPDVSRS
jgi:hypothetical protein